MAFQYVLNKRYDLTYSMNFIGSETLTDNGRFSISISPTDGIINITSFSDEITGEMPPKKIIKKYFKYKNDQDWSEELSIDILTKLFFAPCKRLEMEFHYFRVDDEIPIAGNMTVSNIIINGTYDLGITDSLIMLNPGETVILQPTDIYKIFSLNDYQIMSDGAGSNLSGLEMYFRFTQDGGRHFTKWEFLNADNLKQVKLDPLRFAKVQYQLKSTSVQNPIYVYDILLIGDFQNVSANYLKTNRYGLKEDCLTQLINSGKTSGSPYDLNMNMYTNALSCYTSSVSLPGCVTNQSTDTLWNPYGDITKVTEFSNLLANQANSIIGWTVNYYLTDPDAKGIDYYLGEFVLKNTVDVKQIKVIVPENKFQENTVVINQFNLDLFDTFEINIMKDEFKNAFGLEKRPGESDYLYLCPVNRLYRVKHSQIFRNIMNAGIYYRVILEKYEDRPDIQFLNTEAQRQITELTKNTTIEELFGEAKRAEEAKVSNKDQMFPKSFDKIRQKLNKNLSIVKEDVYNGEMLFSDNHYDLSSMLNKTAVEYLYSDKSMEKGEDRSFVFWFKFNGGNTGMTFNNQINSYNVSTTTHFTFISNIVDTSGYKIEYYNNNLYVHLNPDLSNNTGVYTLPIPQLATDVWYSLVITLDQGVRELKYWVFRRDCDLKVDWVERNTKEIVELYYTSTGMTNEWSPLKNKEMYPYLIRTYDFQMLTAVTLNIVTPISFEHEGNISIPGSNMSLTNIRIYHDTFDSLSVIQKVLNEIIVRDASKLILADNANKKIQTTNFLNKNFR